MGGVHKTVNRAQRCADCVFKVTMIPYRQFNKSKFDGEISQCF